MSYFQNPFAEDYVGALVLADIEKNESFRCPRNTGRSSRQVVAWNTAPYDLSGDD
jgi:hypothetical protein